MDENAKQTGDVSAQADVRIEKLVYGGDGLGRIDGQVLLAPYVLPGELVQVTPDRVKTGLLRGFPDQILEPSPRRIQPRCEYFGSCGGCQYQHADYAFQLEQKVHILRETLRRIGGLEFEQEISVVRNEPWFYRNRIQLHFENGEAGFHRQNSNRIKPIANCYIAAPELVEAIKVFHQAVRRPEWPQFVESIELFSNGSDLQLNVLRSKKPVAARFFEWCGRLLPALKQGALIYHAVGFAFRISGSSFFQVNRFLIEALVSEALQELGGGHAVDLYAGVGLFTLPMAKKFERVDAVERSASASRDLLVNAEQSQGNVRAVKGSAEQFLATQLDASPDLLLADPPRAGLGSEATSQILRILPRRLVVVSCDPATLARDLKALVGPYKVRRLSLLDLFPQTYHFETVVDLERL